MSDQPKTTTTKKEKEKEEESVGNKFEYCKVCKLSHDQGRSHKYFPRHVTSLSSFLSRFKSKHLSDVVFFLENPTPLSPELSSHNRFWCVFCDSLILELGSSFACGNAINHLAGTDHLKNLKSFLWKFGGKMDQVDNFRISEADLAKWEKKSKSLKSGIASEGSGRPLIGPSNDIHNELKSECVDSHEKNASHLLSSNISNCVLPLQNDTNERYQVSQSEMSEVSVTFPPHNVANLCSLPEMHLEANLCGSNNFTGCMNNQQYLVYNGKNGTSDGYLSNGGFYQACPSERMADKGSGSCLQGLQKLTQISSTVQENEGNVHSGAPPPWLDSTEKNFSNTGTKPELGSSNIASSLNKSRKFQKLNPKRVGAAWAERRKTDMEMEKRGEIVTNNFDDNWLPNFGRVWQSGTRKESKKEFVTQNKQHLKTEPQLETLLKIQPYVSKRMRTDAGKES